MGWGRQGPGGHHEAVANAPQVFLVPFDLDSLCLLVGASFPRKRVDELCDTSVAQD